MDTIVTKLKSDRLWVLLAYIAVLVANTQAGLGIPEEQMTQMLYAVIAFILGKSVRGTVGGGMIEALVPQVVPLLTGKAGEPVDEPEPAPEDAAEDTDASGR